jgi:hypothetical protein
MSGHRFLAALLTCAVGWLTAFLAFTWFIDPYGVSPLHVPLKRINEFKPKRLDIDRAIKPLEVWRYQPRSLFLGSSRIHESINPAVLAGTQYAPAYNASIPASTVAMDAANLEQFFRLDPSLKYVFVELFFWNFVYQQDPEPRRTIVDFIRNGVALYLSGTTLFNSVATLHHNLWFGSPVVYVHKDGYWVRPVKFDPKPHFDRYIDEIMRLHSKSPGVALHPTSFAALERIVELCSSKGAELHLIITPNHPYDDYRILSLGYWHVLEDWQRKLAGYPNVLTFSQYHEALVEPISSTMKYWNDPIHFNITFGNLMLRGLLDERGPDIPPDIVLPLNAKTVDEVLKNRRLGLNKWISNNHEFTSAFDRAMFASRNAPSQKR